MECKIKDISINYEIIGNGKPIIMLHGYSVDHRLMRGCMEPIFNDKSDYKRIYIDLPGMGKSESAEWISNSDTMLDIIIEFIKRIIPNENFLLAGESYGGYLSRGIIYKMANMVDGVVLICPVIIADNKKRNVPDHVVLVKDNKLLSKLTSEDAEAFNSMTVVQSKKIYEKYKNEIISGVKMANKNFLEFLMKNGYEFSFDVDNINKKFNKPALVLLGKQDSCVGYKDAWNILNNFPRATFAVLDRAGHNLQIEQEELFNSLIKEWLVRVSA
ncbi:alpha/beta hydrolase [Clostridium botulinum]|uniref:Hydrolase, alpha/beta fold family n=1 Tax=Clostridium botulinum (strain Okra / Type B1) TaxID=498213 RepID=B1IJA1_CLOBK|nr:alpha/beta hydrolase [Clostridium botulinum]ACA46630.1 hydrolase, alpha/beta fold family [Clostridium botulinum B1 str. Okra]MBD5563902.1 alpha/beta hydrolase [Clostridium botulinum]MBD5565724.1 alpha/beta hydrolase [Clostridium botulinum]MBD5569759.1 alpha/beta hydrolase [Clostridium botulinum]MBD5573445.1 alpha/beta hydrolase [Clostridium botulinum]